MINSRLALRFAAVLLSGSSLFSVAEDQGPQGSPTPATPSPATSGPATSGETIYIPVGSQGQIQNAILVPEKGLNQQQVQERFGPPVDRAGPTGTPPITRWEYAEFVVYFEGETVIHTVRKHHPVAGTASQ